MPTKLLNEMIVSEATIPDETVIWRYFPLERFVEIVNKHCLWFSRPFKFPDEWEGLSPPSSYIQRLKKYANTTGESYEQLQQDFCKRRLRHRYARFVNCWHMNDHECDGMWRHYALEKTGIAIQSTVGDVRNGLGSHCHGDGQVIYYDPSQDVSATTFGPHDILFKRRQFSWELEYRFWFNDDELLDRIENGEDIREESLSPGQLVDIGDMGRVIKKIVVAPGASKEFIEQVRSVCIKCKRRWLTDLIEPSYSDRKWDSFIKMV